MLRDYQKDIVKRTKRVLGRGRAPMIVLPTGSGKTNAAIALSENYKKILFIVPLATLMKQTATRYMEAGRNAVYGPGCWPHGIYWPKSAEVVVVSSIVASRRIDWRKQYRPDLIVIDEAHHAALPPESRVYDTNDVSTLVRTAREKGVPVLGLTATPCRLEEDMGFDSLFTSLIIGPSYRELVKEGHLAPLEIVEVGEAARIRSGSVGVIRPGYKDYLASDIMKINSKNNLVELPVLWLYKETDAFRRKAIVYCVNQKHAAEYAKSVAELDGPRVGLLLSSQEYGDIAGISVEFASKKTDREDLVDKFDRGDINVLVNVSIVKEGFDCPSAEVIQVLRPTMSMGLWFQMVGRCSRPADGKETALVLDATNNADRLGNPMDHDPAKWTLKSDLDIFNEKLSRDATNRENERLKEINKHLLDQIENGTDDDSSSIALFGAPGKRRIPNKSRSAYCSCEHKNWKMYHEGFTGAVCDCMVKGYTGREMVPCGCRRRYTDEFLFEDVAGKWRWGRPEGSRNLTLKTKKDIVVEGVAG